MDAYLSQKDTIKKQLEKPSTSEQENNLFDMDYSFYRAVVMTVYHHANLEEFD